jgi:hypothetical protein
MSEQASRGAIAKRAVLIVSLAIVLFFPWSLRPAHAQSEPPGTVTCKPEWDGIKAWLPPGARVELLVAAGNTIPAGYWPRYREAASAILACAGDGAVVELLPITDSGASVSPLFVATAPTPPPDLNNPLRLRLEREQFLKHSIPAIETLYTTTTKFGGFDPLGTLQVAGESLHHGSAGKLVVVMIGNGWQQTDHVNLFRWGDNPANHADDVVRRLKSDGTLPNLATTDVVITGLTRGDLRLKMGSAEITGLCTFWGKVVQAGHGKVVWCKAFLPGMTAPL